MYCQAQNLELNYNQWRLQNWRCCKLGTSPRKPFPRVTSETSACTMNTEILESGAYLFIKRWNQVLIEKLT